MASIVSSEAHDRADARGPGSAREHLLSGLSIRERRLELNGISTAILEGGGGPPIVLLHGAAGSAASWLRVIPALVSTHRVIVPDLPGHGASAGRDALDVERVLAWLDDLIECTCSAPPVLCGNTLGGAIAARYAIARGERVAQLVLVDPLGLTTFQPVPEFGIAIGEYFSRPSPETHERLWRHCAYDLDAMRARLGETWQHMETYNVDRARAEDLGAARDSLMEHFAMPAIAPAELATITAPTTLIWGKYDRATPLAVAQAASTRYGWRLRVIDDAGDEPVLEQPDAFLAALRDELAPTGTSETRAAWNQIATAYDDLVTPSHFWLGNEAVLRANVTKGTRFLDVACGSGALAIPAARHGATVMAVDIAPAMLARLRQRAAAEGLAIETRAVDGHDMDIESDTFDVTGSQFGVMLFSDLPRGLREMVRVTKPGGKVLVVAFGALAQVEFLQFFTRAMKAAIPDFAGPPSDPPPLPFQVSDPDVLRSRMAEAGLREITIEPITEKLEFESGMHYWNWLLGSNPLATMFTSVLSKPQVPIVQQAMERLIRERAAGKPTATLTHPMHIAIGIKPSAAR